MGQLGVILGKSCVVKAPPRYTFVRVIPAAALKHAL